MGSKQDGSDPAENTHRLDSLAFLVMVFLAAKSEKRGFKIPTILRRMAEDATRYFLVIFSAHLALVLTLNLGRVSQAVGPSEMQLITFNGPR